MIEKLKTAALAAVLVAGSAYAAAAATVAVTDTIDPYATSTTTFSYSAFQAAFAANLAAGMSPEAAGQAAGESAYTTKTTYSNDLYSAAFTVYTAGYNLYVTFAGLSANADLEYTVTGASGIVNSGSISSNGLALLASNLGVGSYSFSLVNQGPTAETVSMNYNVQNDPSVVPLPATLPLMAGALGVAGFVARRKKKKAA